MNTLVLLSGGLDSAVLAAHEAQLATVHPVYVNVGLAWESGELQMLERLLAAPVFAGLSPLSRVESTMRDVYPPTHWAIRGMPPAYDTPDEDVYLAGRNLVLLTKAAVVASTKGQGGRDLTDLSGITVPVRATGPLASPSYKLDFASMVTDVAKQKVEERITSEIGKRFGGLTGPSTGSGQAAGKDAAKGDAAKGGSSPKDMLKGLFGR